MRRLGAIFGALIAAFAATSVSLAGFNSSTSATHTIQTKQIFPGSRVTGPRKFTDASSGTGSTVDDALSFPDAIIKTTGNWTTAFATTRYVQFNFNNPLPAGLTVSSATFDFRIIPNASGETACYYFEVHRQSDNSLLGTHFSSGSPQCVTGATYTTISTSLAEVTSSDIANDLYVKVYGRESNSKPIKIDMATLTLTELSTTETLYQEAWTDASTGTGTTTTWFSDAVDSAQYTAATNWSASFASTRYYQFTYPAYLPSGAVVTAATFDHSFKSSTSGPSSCYYFEVYSGSTLLATHGSSTTPVSCATTTFVTDHVSLTEVNTDSLANSVVIKVYVKNSGSSKTIDDLDTLTLTHYVD